MKYTKRNFSILLSNLPGISVDCMREDLWQQPFCLAAMRLMDEDCQETKTDNEHNVRVWPNSAYDAAHIAKMVNYACTKCQHNKVNHKTR